MQTNQKRGQSDVITTILLVLLGLVAVVIVWNIVKPLIEKSGEKVGTEAFTVNLEITEAKLWVTGGAQVKVKRGTGEGDITSLKFVFEKQNGETEIIERKEADEMPDELETKIYDFTVNEINEKIEKVSVAPMFGDNMGMEVSESESKISKDSEGNRVLDVPTNPQDIGLVSWWKFEGDAQDSISSNHGTPVGGVTWANDVARGQAAGFDGVDDYVSCGNDSSLDFSSDFAIVFWFKHYGRQASYDIIFQKGILWDSSKMDLELENIGSESLSFTYAGRNNVYNLPQPTPSGWHNVALVVYDNTRIEGYINGSLSQSFDISGVSQINNNINFYIGGLPGGNYFRGEIDDVMLFNKSLSAEEIKAIYNNQKR